MGAFPVSSLVRGTLFAAACPWARPAVAQLSSRRPTCTHIRLSLPSRDADDWWGRFVPVISQVGKAPGASPRHTDKAREHHDSAGNAAGWAAPGCAAWGRRASQRAPQGPPREPEPAGGSVRCEFETYFFVIKLQTRSSSSPPRPINVSQKERLLSLQPSPLAIQRHREHTASLGGAVRPR